MSNKFTGTMMTNQNDYSNLDISRDAQSGDSSDPAGLFGKSESTDLVSRLRLSTSFGQDSIASSFQTFHAAPDDSPPVVTTENERQILLLMLLAQVCALHDPTPRTFTVHVLELYERGILDRESIGFLFDLGLIPQYNSPVGTHSFFVNGEDQENAIQLRHSLDHNLVRAQEASAIRRKLQRQESSGQPNINTQDQDHLLNSNSLISSWNVDEHPLSLSRYSREFQQVKLLNSGSFGSVFHVTNKMDTRDYAVKRVIFSESGYSNETVTQIVREVRCLARCDHPHVVRYHTSWLEPSWVTGSGTVVSSANPPVPGQRRLLTDFHRLISDKMGDDGNYGDKESYGRSLNEESTNSFASEWSSSSSADALQLQEWIKADISNGEDPPAYRYQMCFFIQMQLCKPETLADYIRVRKSLASWKDYDYANAIDIFLQLAQGLEHIHAEGIVHRDMKPANCLVGEDGLFKIGDFGLSTLLRRAKARNSSAGTMSTEVVKCPTHSMSSVHDSDWQDPLTKGVGTASYCAPEQVATTEYGPSADIFSLGLILLELCCSFGTEHEQIHTFQNCRRGVLPDSLKEMHPLVANTILSCTHIQPSMRPTAKHLVDSPLRFNSGNEPHEDHIEGWRATLIKQEDLIQKQRSELFEKDKIIEELRREIDQLKQSSNTSCILP